MEELRGKTIKLIDELEAAEEFEPNESALCDWCDFQHLCPKRKHLFKVKDLPVNKYLNDDGVKLVNEYANLEEQKKEYKGKIAELDAEESDIAEATIKYGEKEGVETIVGSDYQLKIKKSISVSSPGKGRKRQ